MSETVQQTLDGGSHDPDFSRVRPDTWVVCPECGDVLRRLDRFTHPHETVAVSEWRDQQADDAATDESPYEHFDADEEVGKYFDVTISRTVEYRFRVPAWSDSEATEIAEDWALDATPCDAWTTHTETRSAGSIERQELPDEWDPYGGERMHEVLGDAE